MLQTDYARRKPYMRNVLSPETISDVIGPEHVAARQVRVDRGQRVFAEVVFVDCHCGETIVRSARPRRSLAATGIAAKTLTGLAVEDVTDMATSSSVWEARE